MRDDICTIPVSEIFEVDDGCPICRMYKTVEDRIMNYILGDAMMEPDVRIETNRLGFCNRHLDGMFAHKGRLQLSLMLQTHIKETSNKVFGGVFSTPQKSAEKAKEIGNSCFICNKVEWGIDRMIETVYRCYENERDFRELFNNQSQFCLVHYARLTENANKRKMPKYHKEFCDNLTRITKSYADGLYEGVSAYCSMYDYRNGGKSADGSLDCKTAPEKTAAFLKGEYFKDE